MGNHGKWGVRPLDNDTLKVPSAGFRFLGSGAMGAELGFAKRRPHREEE